MPESLDHNRPELSAPNTATTPNALSNQEVLRLAAEAAGGLLDGELLFWG